jgi:hypothetical protein
MANCTNGCCRGGGSAEAFASLQEHLARHITDTWPFGSGDLCFRTKVTTRRFHSILTAAAQYGLRPAQVQDLLQVAGLQGALPLPEYEQVYDARAVEQVLEAVSSSISMQAAMVKLGLTRNQMTTLIDAGYLTVSRGGDRSRPRFSPADISAFLDLHRNIPVEPSRGTGGDSVSILVAARRFGVSTAQIYGLFVEGKLSRVRRARDDLYGPACMSVFSKLAITFPPTQAKTKCASATISCAAWGRRLVRPAARG